MLVLARYLRFLLRRGSAAKSAAFILKAMTGKDAARRV